MSQLTKALLSGMRKRLITVSLSLFHSGSILTPSFISTVRHLIVDLVGNHDPNNKHGPVSPSEISVISPFREQVWKIRLALRAVGLSNVGLSYALLLAEY